ncbi:histidine kinase [Serratia marcescens]|uniref:Histidine kinase n=1 Tax=Serratia marcescens TaxID=615 RepID=A0A1Q4P5T9_SERMA|nr:histidine kinase [Serratia marcescens]OKB68515.1 histidine kinase [Serratia marcescens]
MLASWGSAGLLVLGALVGSVGAHLQVNAVLAIAGVMMAAGIAASALTECGGGR